MRVIPRPVLKGIFGKVSNGQNQSAQVPDTHDNVGQIDLLNPAPLFFHDHGIVNFYRLREGNLDSGKQIHQRLLQGKANDDSGYASTRQNRRAKFTHTRKAQQNHGQTE